MEKSVEGQFKTLVRLSTTFFKDLKMDTGAYTSANPLKRYAFYHRMSSLLEIFPHDLDKNSIIVDFGAGQCMFSILLLSLGYRRVMSVDVDEDKLRQGLALTRYYNQVLGTDFALQTYGEMPACEIDLVCAIDVFEHFSPAYAREVIRSANAPRYLLNLPSENFLYNLGTGFHREPGHQTRYYEVVETFKDCGFGIVEKCGFLGLFHAYLMERIG
ncbi:MAG: class I SAM-dependent methyltransferase [Actinobacteria bacterium]|jgi:hypothetical protein|nr:MAG: class I SAM-dependent methyltransferase [Actinomycetota bacterium]